MSEEIVYILTKRNLMLPSPEDIPDWVETTEIPDVSKYLRPTKETPVDTTNWQWFNYPDLFDIKRGNISSLGEYEEGTTPVVTASATENGISAYINKEADFLGNSITVSTNGSIGEAFYQANPFCPSADVAVLVPKFKLTEAIALFLCTLIRLEKPRYNYGYKWSLGRMQKSRIKLPTKEGAPDWEWIEKFMKKLSNNANS